MKRLLGQTLVLASFGASLAALAPACADNDQALFIRNVLAPPTNRQNGACIYTPDPSQPVISEGSLDVAFKSTYDMQLIVGSQLVARGESDNVRSESNRAHVNGAVVRVTDANGGAINEFTTIGAAFLDPQLNNAPSYAAVGISAIDSETVRRIRASGLDAGGKLVIANIKLFGKTLGGVDLESGEFQFPIKVCIGCLVVFPATADDPATPGRDCNLKLDAAGGGSVVSPCQFGQDEHFSCQLCSGEEACQPPK